MILSIFLALAATGAPPIEPASNWNLALNAHQCEMKRPMGNGKTAAEVSFATFGTDPLPNLTITLPRGTFLRKEGDLFIVADDGVSVPAHFERDFDVNFRNRAKITLPRDQFQRFLSSNQLLVTNLAGKPVTLTIGGSDKVFQSFAQCESDLHMFLGVKPEDLAKIATPAVGAPGYIVHGSDYPAEAIAARQQGDAIVMWEIGKDAVIRNCHVVQSSTFPLLDQASCDALLKHGKYLEPAKDAAGNPVISWSTRRMVWRLP